MAVNMTHEDIDRISQKFRNNYPNILTLFQTRELIQQIELLEGNSNECIVSKMLNRNEISYWYALKPETLNLIEDFISKAIKNKENILGENSNQTHYVQENVLLNVSLKRHIQITNFPENEMTNTRKRLRTERLPREQKFSWPNQRPASQISSENVSLKRHLQITDSLENEMANAQKRPRIESLSSEEQQISWLNQIPSSQVASWTHEHSVRERNKTLHRIIEEEGGNVEESGIDILPPGDDGEREREKLYTALALSLRKANVDVMFKTMRKARRLDLCFLVDITMSMRRYIDEVKNVIRFVVEKLVCKSPSIRLPIVDKLRFAFVGYRDYFLRFDHILRFGPQFEVHDFTESYDDFHKFCQRIVAKGGSGDRVEDVFGGLDRATTLNWTRDGSTRMLFHIADNPCHGREFHSGMIPDNYPNGDPYGLKMGPLFDRINNKQIQYFFGKITDQTDKMLEKFSDVYDGEIVVCDLKDVASIMDNIISSSSLAVSQVGNFPGKPKIDVPLDKTMPQWNKLSVFNAVLLSYEFPKYMNDIKSMPSLIKKQTTKTLIQVSKEPFAKGSERVVYYGRDLAFKTDIVLKRYVRKDGEKDFGRKTFSNHVQDYENGIQAQTIAAYMASKFTNELFEKVRSRNQIKFLKGQIISYVDENKQRVHMSSEKCYPHGSSFIRFTNNKNYTMHEMTATLSGVDLEFVKQLNAFSHWTFQISGGYFMVVDLQGVISIDGENRKCIELTDPAIHCIDSFRFARTNLGEDGMKLFFSNHICNEICHKMDLIFPDNFVEPLLKF